jgi:hypothetical protein
VSTKSIELAYTWSASFLRFHGWLLTRDYEGLDLMARMVVLLISSSRMTNQAFAFPPLQAHASYVLPQRRRHVGDKTTRRASSWDGGTRHGCERQGHCPHLIVVRPIRGRDTEGILAVLLDRTRRGGRRWRRRFAAEINGGALRSSSSGPTRYWYSTGWRQAKKKKREEEKSSCGPTRRWYLRGTGRRRRQNNETALYTFLRWSKIRRQGVVLAASS